MTPANMVGMASIKGLDLIALTDHNSSKNCPAFLKRAEEFGILALPGMELTTEEEVHVVCLFDTLDKAMAFDSYVYEHLLAVPNREEIFGKQQILDENDDVVGTVTNLLINATTIRFDQVPNLMQQFDGVMIPAHIDKGSNSLIANLGFVPPDASFVTAEVKDLKKLHELRNSHPYLKRCRIISDSDAHYLENINEAVNTLYVEERTASAVIALLRNANS